jgi:hypothetical protein
MNYAIDANTPTCDMINYSLSILSIMFFAKTTLEYHKITIGLELYLQIAEALSTNTYSNNNLLLSCSYTGAGIPLGSQSGRWSGPSSRACGMGQRLVVDAGKRSCCLWLPLADKMCISSRSSSLSPASTSLSNCCNQTLAEGLGYRRR